LPLFCVVWLFTLDRIMLLSGMAHCCNNEQVRDIIRQQKHPL
jgi:hypothetical protein